MKEHASDEAARAEAEKLVREKTGKGYGEVQRGDDAAAPEGGALTGEQWWQRLEQSGWCAEVPASEVKRIRTALKKHGPDLSDAFDVLAPSGMDAECIENDGDYSKLVSSYAKASCGLFRPAKVRDTVDLDEEVAVLSLEAGGKKFKREFEQPDDYVADEFHDFMNSVLAKLGEKRRFFTLPSEDQTAGIVCVTPGTYKRAQRLGLIPRGGADYEDKEEGDLQEFRWQSRAAIMPLGRQRATIMTMADDDGQRTADFNQLRWSLQGLAIAGSEQLALFPEYAAKADELAQDFAHRAALIRDTYEGTLSRSQDESLAAIEQKLATMSRDGAEFDVELWSDAALCGSEQWADVRGLASAALEAFGWPVESPSQNPGDRGTLSIR